ncbi:MAG: SulP family inorganic anion transporter [Luteolibacter sp.]|jgi:SulP family sulfate permease|nr:SulP family inorganic anion transporter [Luteolibacter sp.]
MLARLMFKPRLLEVFSGNYSRADLGNDIMAGLTVGMIALPLALALGIASVPAGAETPFPAPALGIFTAIIAGFLISVFGGSRVQIGGPTAAFIPIILLIIEKHGYAGLMMATVMAGVILVIMGLAKMGSLIKYIPWPVTSGFTTGIAVAIMATQSGDFLGIHTSEPAPREFAERLHWLGAHLGDINLPTLILALGCLTVIVFWPKLGLKRVPGSIVAMLGATALVAAFGWQESLGISTIGSKFGSAAIPSGLPAVTWPHIDWAMMRDLIGPATAIALLGAIESLLSAVVADGLTSDRHDSNTELVAQGLANIFCPFFGGLPATGAIARTSANVNNGGRSPVSGIVHSLTLLGIILLFAKWAAFVPMAAMSAVLVFVALRMGEWHEMKRLRLMPLSDAVVLLTTFALTVIFDLVIAVEVGMVLAAMLFIKRVSDTTEVSQVFESDVLESPEQLVSGKEIPEDVLVYRIFGPFLFGAAEKMEDAIERVEKLPKVLILRLHLVSAMDATALNALESVIERFQNHRGTVILSGLHRQPLDMLRKAGFVKIIGRQNLVAHFDDALIRAREILNEEL